MIVQTQREGLTLVELLIVAVLTAVLLGAVYQSLIVQEESYAAATQIISDQEAARTALGILEAELREVGSVGGEDIGGTDIAVASADSIVFRAQRKIGIICKLSRGDNWLLVWPLGEDFVPSDKLIVFVDGDSLKSIDDRWDTSYVSNTSTKTDTDCEAAWPGMVQQELKVPDGGGYAVLDSVRTGGPVRGYEWVTYSLKDYGDEGWGLTRQRAGDPARLLVTGLAPSGTGLTFEYFDSLGAATNDPTAISRLRVTVQTDPPAKAKVDTTVMSTNVYLRNN